MSASPSKLCHVECGTIPLGVRLVYWIVFRLACSHQHELVGPVSDWMHLVDGVLLPVLSLYTQSLRV